MPNWCKSSSYTWYYVLHRRVSNWCHFFWKVIFLVLDFDCHNMAGVGPPPDYMLILTSIIWSYGHMIILESIPTSCKKSAKKSIRVHLCREQHSCLHICTTNGCPPWLLKDNLVLPRPFMDLFLHLPQQIFGFLYEAVVSNHNPKTINKQFRCSYL